MRQRRVFFSRERYAGLERTAHGRVRWWAWQGGLIGGIRGAKSAANHLWHSQWALEGLRLLFQTGKNGVLFQACLSHMGNGSVLLLSSFPELKRFVGAWRWRKGGSILNCHCLPGTEGSGEIKHGQCDTNKEAVPLLWKIRKEHWKGRAVDKNVSETSLLLYQL